MREPKPIRSTLCVSTPDKITVQGLDLPSQILGKLSLGDMAWLEITGKQPTPQQSVVFNALLVTLVEHGMTPMAIATRLVYLGAPESLQAAVGAGLCGLGTVFAGTAEGAARMLQDGLRSAGTRPLPEVAAAIVADFRAQKRGIPGIGHPLHKPVDPRTPRLFQIARENGYEGRHVELMKLVAAEAERVLKKSLPINATGAIGAIASELGLDWRLCRGIAVIGRAVGLVGHIAEELRNPVALEIWERVDYEAATDLREARG
jgi:citrate synthase